MHRLFWKADFGRIFAVDENFASWNEYLLGAVAKEEHVNV